MANTRVYVLRHGQSTFNIEGRLQGCSDEPDLTQAGIAAADAAAEYLGPMDIDAVITSPLRRASCAAARICERIRKRSAQAPTYVLDSHLREIEMPMWEGMPLATIRREFAEQYRVWSEQPHLFRMPEDRWPVPALYLQAERFWGRLLTRFSGKNVLLVTHGGTGRALISTALGIPAERYHRIQQSNGGISVLEFPNRFAGGVRLSAVNATDYLGERLPKVKESKTGSRILLVPAGGADPIQLRHTGQVLRKIRIHAAFGDSIVNREVALRFLRGGVNSEVRAGISEKLPRLDLPPEPVINILWVVQEKLLLRMLVDVLGLPPNDAALLSPVPFTFTVLHYAADGRAPVLQAVNLHDVGRVTREPDQRLSVKCA